jgi:hypothetical protein
MAVLAAAGYDVARRLGVERPIASAVLPPAQTRGTGPRPLAVPPRPNASPSGSAFASVRRLVPLHMRTRPTSTNTAAKTTPIEALLWVLPDYLSIGTDDDFLRVPMMATTAQKIADQLGCTLPTRAIVDAIYAQAPIKLDPLALETNADMVTTDDYALHQAKIEEQRRARRGALGAVTAGHKKDIVLSAQLATRPDRVAIYGMHKNGEPIQSLSLIHELAYVDYAHGVRLVFGDTLVGPNERRIVDVLADPVLSLLLSDEGVFRVTHYPMKS